MILVALVIAALTSPAEAGPDKDEHWGANESPIHERHFEEVLKKD